MRREILRHPGPHHRLLLREGQQEGLRPRRVRQEARLHARGDRLQGHHPGFSGKLERLEYCLLLGMEMVGTFLMALQEHGH